MKSLTAAAAALIAAAILAIAGCNEAKTAETSSVSETEVTSITETAEPASSDTKGVNKVRTAEELAGKKVIALTFDDGPNTKATADILDIVEEYGIKVSFFVIGSNINSESGKVMQRAHSLGCEINSHSFTHSYMNEMSADKIKDEMQRTSDLIFEYVGERPKFFRPPYIAVSQTMYDNIDLPFICGLGCNDWEDSVSAEKREIFISEKCPDGSIVLLHDQPNNTRTVEAVRKAVPKLLEQGFEFVTVSELFEAKGITPVSDGVLYSYASANGWTAG